MPVSSRPKRNTGARTAAWRLSMGANVNHSGTTFRVWAPAAHTVDVELGNTYVPLNLGDDGVWTATVQGAGDGARYRYRIDGDGVFPDPYSRSQPDGPHGPSQVVDPSRFKWHDAGWPGVRTRDLVIYECHVGVYTTAGTFDALADDLGVLRELGITAIELMPVAEFPGARNWGYDGVNLFAPSRNYGGPEGLRRLVDAAHNHGIGIILDVVYNHFGPDGNYLAQFSRDYLTGKYNTPWGDAINFDGDNSQQVRRYYLDNVRYWLNEYHVDGIRLDAAFAIFDSSPQHILGELTTAARSSVARDVVMIAETYENDARYVRRVEQGGLGFDAVWADDFHHSVHAAASHEQSGYYIDYTGATDELAQTINRGWLFEGRYSQHLKGIRGAPSDGIASDAFVYFIQNHDQVGNRAFGRRISHLIGAAAQRPWSALMLLLPFTPLIFAGEEFAASSRFHYFADHDGDLGRAVSEGRRAEIAALHPVQDGHPIELQDPQLEETFLATKLNLAERESGVGEHMWALYRSLLKLRRDDSVLANSSREQMRAIAASPQLLLVHRWRGNDHRLIVANLGVAIDGAPATCGVPEELASFAWEPIVSTEERRFGGGGDHVRVDPHLVSLPPHTVALLGASAPLRPVRALQAIGRALGLPERRRDGN